MTELQIRKGAKQAFLIEDYETAFSGLWQLGVENFLEYAQKQDNKSKKFNWLAQNSKCKKCSASSEYFWKTFILKEEVFESCFSSKLPVELLHNYYSKNVLLNEEFELRLASTYPSVFIEAIRKNEVFFKESRIGFLCKNGLLPVDYQIHQKVWRSFYETELDIWQQIEAACDEFIMHPMEQVLFVTIEYFESNNYQANFDLLNQATLAETYSFFIDLLRTKGFFNKVNSDSEEFNNQFNQYISQSETSNLKLTIFRCLELIKKRVNFKSVYFESYCYNPEFQPKLIYGSLHFCESLESYYNWSVDELRYRINEHVYVENAIQSSTTELAWRMQSLIKPIIQLFYPLYLLHLDH